MFPAERTEAEVERRGSESLEFGPPETTRSRAYAAQVTGPGSAELSVTGGGAELTVHHFSPPPGRQIYKVWLSRPGRRARPDQRALQRHPQGNGAVDVPGDLHRVELVMVTPEPARASQVPTRIRP
jgi:hypothetical protein